jgi:hypothetical protein
MITNLAIVLYILAATIGSVPTYFFLKSWRNNPKADPIIYSILPYALLWTLFLSLAGLITLISSDSVMLAFGFGHPVRDVIHVGHYIGAIALSEVITWLFMVVAPRRPRHFHVLV